MNKSRRFFASAALAVASTVTPAIAQTATAFGSIALAADGTYQIAVAPELDGLYALDWDGPNRAEHYLVSVDVQQYDTASVQILNSTDFGGQIVFSNFRVVSDSSNSYRYFVVDVANRAGGTGNMNVTAFGAEAGLSLSATPGGSTPITNQVFTLGGRSGNVGIGTMFPQAILHVHGNFNNTGSGGIMLDASDSSNPTVPDYYLSINPFVIGDSAVGYQFKTVSYAGGTYVPLTLGNVGTVGIGTTSPGKPLDVSGTIRTSAAGVDTGGIIYPDGSQRNPTRLWMQEFMPPNPESLDAARP